MARRARLDCGKHRTVKRARTEFGIIPAQQGRISMMKQENNRYRDRIAKLVDDFPLEIDKNVVIEGRAPT